MSQNYSNHRRWVPMYHIVLSILILLLFIGSIVNLIESINSSSGVYSASLITVMNFCLLIIFYYMRMFALKAQDRAIRAEENLRYFAKTGKLLPAELSIRQIIGLRFASDDEYTSLMDKAVKENLNEDTIKKSITNWKEDNYRV